MAQAEATGGWARPARGLEIVLPTWRAISSARFALVIIGFLAVAGLLSVVLPQVPAAMRGNPAAEAAWIEFQKGRFGPFTEPMYRLGFFTVFEARWFLGALAVLGLSVFAYMANRLPALWKNIARPQERVPDAFFDRAANRASFAVASAGEAASLPGEVAALLARRRFRVRMFEQAGDTHLFADRFAWGQIGGFVSHAALVLFLVGGLLSRCGGYTNALFIAEGTTSPVFAVSHPDQMQVEVLDAKARFDAGGSPLDYRTELAVYQGGREVARGATTVNDPLSYNGYRFHQAGYFGEGAALRVRDAATGNTLYQEVLALEDLVPAPAVRVTDAGGNPLVDDVIVPTEQLGGVWGTPVRLPNGERYWLGVNQSDLGRWQLLAFSLSDEQVRAVVPAGAAREAGGLGFALREVTGLPSISVPSSSAPVIPGDRETSLVVMSETTAGDPYLTAIGPVDGYALTLYADQPVRIGDREYTFEGRREFAGIEVRRDPGANFIWVAAGLLLASLAVAFYLPRLRLWARVRGNQAAFAGLAEQSGRFESEMKQLEKQLSARGVERETDA